MNTYDELCIQLNQIRAQRDLAFTNAQSVITRSNNVADLAHNCSHILAERECVFEQGMHLNSLDMSFLGFAIALQCARQYLLSNDKFRFSSDSQGHDFFEKLIPADLLGPVPYDAFKKNSAFIGNTGISGANHRVTTLGHDPLLGWIFGTLNILTNTITKNDILLTSYNTALVGNEYYITSPRLFATILPEAFGKVCSNPKALVNAVERHAAHLATDAFTKMGLPLPVLNSVNPDLSLLLAKNGIDTYSTARGCLVSALINMIIAVVHGLFCDAKGTEDALIYSAKTHKIIMLANGIASTSNILYVAITKDLKKLDLGGLLVTLHRIVTDYELIYKLKEEYVCGGFDRMVREA